MHPTKPQFCRLLNERHKLEPQFQRSSAVTFALAVAMEAFKALSLQMKALV